MISILSIAVTLAVANGFSSINLRRHSKGERALFSPSITTVEAVTDVSNDFGSAMPEVDPHDIIGVEPDKLAIGIDASEFLELIGT